MGNNQLLDAVQGLLEGMERRIEKRMDQRFGEVYVRLDSIDRKLALQAGVLSHMVQWSDKVEDEIIRLSAGLAEIQARVAKLEHGTAS